MEGSYLQPGARPGEELTPLPPWTWTPTAQDCEQTQALHFTFLVCRILLCDTQRLQHLSFSLDLNTSSNFTASFSRRWWLAMLPLKGRWETIASIARAGSLQFLKVLHSYEDWNFNFFLKMQTLFLIYMNTAKFYFSLGHWLTDRKNKNPWVDIS